jgi:hypothetical protein
VQKQQIRNEKKQSRGLQKLAPGNTDLAIVAPEKTPEQLVAEIKMLVCEATGTQRCDVADRIINQVSSAQVFPRPRNDADHFDKAIAVISELAPQNATEAMLAVQMIATNDAALMFLRRATDGQSLAVADASVLWATRLMRLHLDQIEAMQKLKGKTRHQKVVVEHVHVHQGGQAIVGAISAVKTETRGVGD